MPISLNKNNLLYRYWKIKALVQIAQVHFPKRITYWRKSILKNVFHQFSGKFTIFCRIFFLSIQMMLFTLLVNTLHCLFLILSQSEAGDMKTVVKMVAVSGVWMTLRVISHWSPWLVSSNPPVLSRSIPGGPATATQHS